MKIKRDNHEVCPGIVDCHTTKIDIVNHMKIGLYFCCIRTIIFTWRWAMRAFVGQLRPVCYQSLDAAISYKRFVM
jgi:hypothetical protein